MGIRIATRRVVGLCCLLTLALTPVALGQTEPMTNQDVIELVEGGLGASVLVAAIGRADTVAFDVDRGLLDLARAGVPDAVITAMIAKQTEQDEAEAVTAAAVAGTARPPGIYLIEEEGVGQRLEPTAYSAASASGWRARLTLGIARDQAKATVPRTRSQVRTGVDRPRFRFVFPDANTAEETFSGSVGGVGAATWWNLVGSQVTNPNQFVLARMESKDGRRELVVGQVNQFGYSSGPRGEDMIEFDYELVGPNVYEVAVTESLRAGEYCFFPILAGNVVGQIGGAGASQIFDFGVGP